MATRTVVSIEKGTSTQWECQLLAWSRWQHGVDPGPLTVLSAAGTPELDLSYVDELFVHRQHRNLDGADYPPYNKPAGLRDWLAANPPAEETILLVDPDVAWLGPAPEFSAGAGRAVGQDWGVVGMTVDLTGAPLVAVTERPQGLQAVGVPLWIGRDDLAGMVDLWIERTAELRRRGELAASRRRRRAQSPAWIPEMGGYVSAAADAGIVHELVDVDCDPLLHYYLGHCFSAEWFSKYRYRPWAPIGVPIEEGPARAFAELLNAYVAERAGEAAA